VVKKYWVAFKDPGIEVMIKLIERMSWQDFQNYFMSMTKNFLRSFIFRNTVWGMIC